MNINSKLAILLSVALASGTALAAGGYDQSTGGQAAMDQGVTGGTADQGTMSGSDQSIGSDQDMSGSNQGPTQGQEQFSQVDTNADGLISEDEAQGTPVADNFNQADTNGDGYVNQSEYNSMLGEQNLQE